MKEKNGREEYDNVVSMCICAHAIAYMDVILLYKWMILTHYFNLFQLKADISLLKTNWNGWEQKVERAQVN